MNKVDAYFRHISKGGSLSRQDLSELPVEYAVIIKAFVLAFTLPTLIFLPRDLLIALFVSVGIAWSVWGIRILYLSGASKRWTVTQGVIIENSVGRIVVPSSPGWHAESYPIIAFRYTMDGVEYVSRKVVLFPSDLRVCDDPMEDPPYRATMDFCARFPLNSSVDVHYDPQAPRVSVLMTGALSRSWQNSIVFLVLGCFLVLLGIFLFNLQ